MAVTNVYPIGDSSLENVYWHMNGNGSNLEEAKAKSVEGQLQANLGPQYQVISHAYDGFTTTNVLEGGFIGAVFKWDGEKVAAYIQAKKPDPNKPDRFVMPLQRLADAIKKQDPLGNHVVVISVGGNDFRLHLQNNPLKLLTDVPNIQNRYLQIVERVRKLGPNVRPVLMFQYRTDGNNDGAYRVYFTLGIAARFAAAVNLLGVAGIAAAGVAIAARKVNGMKGGIFITIASLVLYGMTWLVPLKVTKGILKGQSPGMTMIGALMEKFYQPMLKYAVRHGLPILDLPNSFNPYEKLYSHGIEPSEEGGKLIAQGLSTIISGDKAHDYGSSKIYRCSGDVRPTSLDWQVEYVSKSQ